MHSLYELDASVIILLLFALMAITYVLGFRLRKLFEKKQLSESHTDWSVLQSSLLALFAFFLGFTFNMSAGRFDTRRQVIVEEANCIGTAILRADLYPDSIRYVMRAHFKKYVDYRIDYFNAGIDQAKINTALQQSTDESTALWHMAIQLSRDNAYTEGTRSLIPALNDMIDAVTTRDAAKNANVPPSIIWVLFALSIFSSFIIGYGTKSEHLNYIAGFVFISMVSISIYLIIDLDRPRRGIINLEDANQRIVELRGMFE